MVIARFSKPPLREVSFGVEFEASAFSAIHFGLYWKTISDRFKEPEDREPLGNSDDDRPYLPRIWVESFEQNEILQLQAGQFLYNWHCEKSSNNYPHFHKIYPRFLKEWNHFKDWWAETIGEPLDIVSFRLGYLNIIDKDCGWSGVADTAKVFTISNKEWSSFLGVPNEYNFDVSYSLPENGGNLAIKVDSAYYQEDDSPILFFELSATSFEFDMTPDFQPDIDPWFDKAHSYITNAFLYLTQQEIQKSWGRTQ